MINLLDEEEKITFDKEVDEVLKNEIKELTYKIKKVRQEENWGTYKNLITAYTQVLGLIRGNKEDRILTPSQSKNFDKFIDICVNKDIIRNYLNDKLQDTVDDIDISIAAGNKDNMNELIKKRDSIKSEINELNSNISPLEKLMRTVDKCIGRYYTWGGNTYEMGFDCSGLIEYLYAQINIKIPRCTYDQVKEGIEVYNINCLQIGDLLFFGDREQPHHVGMYVGDGKFVNATSTGIKISNLSDNEDFAVAKRIIF